jgi:hypothetical protein
LSFTGVCSTGSQAAMHSTEKTTTNIDLLSPRIKIRLGFQTKRNRDGLTRDIATAVFPYRAGAKMLTFFSMCKLNWTRL